MKLKILCLKMRTAMDNIMQFIGKISEEGMKVNQSQYIVRWIFVLCVYLNHAPSLPCEQIALDVYITTSSHRLPVTYLVCFMRTTWLTSAKSHARQKLCSHGTPSLPQWYNRSSPRFLHVLKTGITQQNLSTTVFTVFILLVNERVGPRIALV